MPNRKVVLRASIWTLLGFGLSQVLRLGANIIVAALLFEEAFAMMAIVNAVIQGLAMFSDIGLGPNVVQNRRGDDRDFLNTIWTLQVIRGFGLSIIAIALTWPVAAFYEANDPMAAELRGLLPLAAIATIFAGFNSTKLLSASRHMTLGRVTLIDLIAQIAGLVTMVVGAWLTRSMYALVAGSIVSAALLCVCSHVLVPGPGNSFRWDKEAAKEIIRFGKWIFLSTVLAFLAVQIDRLTFPKLFPLDQVGVYAIAATLARLVPNLIGRLQMSVAFPLLARTQTNNPERFIPLFVRLRFAMLTVTAYCVAVLIAGSDSFFALAYDERYQAAAQYMAILAMGVFFVCQENFYGSAYLAQGRPSIMAAANSAKVVSFSALVLPAARIGGLTAAVIAVTLSELVKMIVVLMFRRRLGKFSLLTDLILCAYCFVVGFVSRWFVDFAGEHLQLTELAKLVLAGVTVSVLFAPLLPRARSILSAK